jgi:DNA-binding transcriptional ArsR family regulator
MDEARERKLVALFKSLSNIQSIRIYNLLKEKGEMSLPEIAETLYSIENGDPNNSERARRAYYEIVRQRVRKLEKVGLVKGRFRGASRLGGHIKYLALRVPFQELVKECLENEEEITPFVKECLENEEEITPFRVKLRLRRRIIKGREYWYVEGKLPAGVDVAHLPTEKTIDWMR